MNINDKLKTLPTKPGCYLMKDKNGKVIYVGKAIILKNRVNSYFRGAHDYKTTKLVSNICDFDFIITKSEKEALILEYNLIKQYNPYFNIVFKDDKSYPYIQLSQAKEPYVKVIRLNKKTKYKGKFFGPYPDVTAARKLVELINKLYPTRKCDTLQHDYCLYFHLNQCLGYCKNNIDDKLSSDIKNKICCILNGDIDYLIKELKENMNIETENLNYEKAIYYRDLINDIKETTLSQDVQINKNETFDVFNYDVEDGYIAITGLFVKNGKLLNTHKYLDFLVGDPENFVSSYIYQFYSINNEPKKLYLPKELMPYFEEYECYPCLSVTRGNKYQLLKQAKLNSKENLRINKEIVSKNELYKNDIKNEFKRIFNKDINRIEIFDNSHTAGHETVAGMVVYKNYKPSKKDYRLYKLDDGADDLKSMNEVLYRRYFRILKDNLEMPDLLIVDGAKTQIEVAKNVIKSLNIDIPIVGLGKDDHHNTSYMMNEDFEIININKDSNLFFFLTNMQDEVHRFAIEYHKKLRKKAVFKSFLDDIDGLGPKYRNNLLKKYKTIANIKSQNLSELQTVLPNKVALRLYNKIKEEENDN